MCATIASTSVHSRTQFRPRESRGALRGALGSGRVRWTVRIAEPINARARISARSVPAKLAQREGALRKLLEIDWSVSLFPTVLDVLLATCTISKVVFQMFDMTQYRGLETGKAEGNSVLGVSTVGLSLLRFCGLHGFPWFVTRERTVYFPRQ